MLVDAQGNVICNSGSTPQVYAYDAYGLPNRFRPPPQALTTHLYSGERTDQLTGLQYLRARYYNPSSGTFNRLDPFAGNFSDPQSLHKYLYTHGDPVNGIDPSGMLNLVSLGFSVNWSTNTRLQGAGPQIRAANSVNKTLKAFSQAYSRAEKAWDWVNAARDALDILDFDPRDLWRIQQTLSAKLGISPGAALPTGLNAKGHISLPSGLIRKLRKVLRGTTENNMVQGWIGTLGSAIVAKALGFESTSIGSAYTGIDGVLKDPLLGRFTILEAKGGSSTLDGSRGQMYDGWIRDRLDKIARENRNSPDYTDFANDVAGTKLAIPTSRMWAILVKLDIRRGKNDLHVAIQEYPGINRWGKPFE